MFISRKKFEELCDTIRNLQVENADLLCRLSRYENPLITYAKPNGKKKSWSRNRQSVEINGKSYLSIKDAAMSLDLGYQTLAKKIQNIKPGVTTRIYIGDQSYVVRKV